MQFSFYKYHGSGNDFIVADNRRQSFPTSNHSLIKKICDRNFGIGSDGMMLLEDKPGYDFHMRYFNSDGMEGSMCGNGGRCIVHFARELGIIQSIAKFSGVDGGHKAIIDERGLVHLEMQNVDKINKDGKAYILDTGSPHYILFSENISGLDVLKKGRAIRNSKLYKKEGINVNFVEPAGNFFRIRTYERGVEDETLACGTGSVAAALCIAVEKGISSTPVNIETKGGMLEVDFRQTGKTSFRNIWLTGPAKLVFTGNIELGTL